MSGHAWNQVNIDGKWYNTDLTWDKNYMADYALPEYCLKSDKDFLNHYPLSSNTEKCADSYNLKEIKQCLTPIYQQEEAEINEIVDLLTDMEIPDEGNITKPKVKQQNSKDVASTSLMAYKPSIWSKISNPFKKFFNKLKFSKNNTDKKKRNIKEEKYNYNNKNGISNSKQYDSQFSYKKPSWDLSNWPSFEFKAYIPGQANDEKIENNKELSNKNALENDER